MACLGYAAGRRGVEGIRAGPTIVRGWRRERRRFRAPVVAWPHPLVPPRSVRRPRGSARARGREGLTG